MWKDDNNKIDDILMNINDKENKFPMTCPICGRSDTHFYMTRFEPNDEHGSAWIWCSSCLNYSHFQYKIPLWWSNCPSVDIDSLESEPTYLDNQKNVIDDWCSNIFKDKESK